MFRFKTTSTAAALCASLFVTFAFAQKPAESSKAAPTAATKSSTCKLDTKGTPVKVKLTTSMGAITLELNSEKAHGRS